MPVIFSLIFSELLLSHFILLYLYYYIVITLHYFCIILSETHSLNSSFVTNFNEPFDLVLVSRDVRCLQIFGRRLTHLTFMESLGSDHFTNFYMKWLNDFPKVGLRAYGIIFSVWWLISPGTPMHFIPTTF